MKLFIPTQEVYIEVDNEEIAIETQKRLFEENDIVTWIVYTE